MKEMLDVFRMEELTVETRIKVIQKLAAALNFQFGANWTDEVEAELVSILKEKLKTMKILFLIALAGFLIEFARYNNPFHRTKKLIQ